MKEEVPPPAEACTEIGADDGLEAIGSFVLVGVITVALVVAILVVIGVFF